MDTKKNQICEFCGTYFTAARNTKKYCSDKCRAAAHRQAATFKSVDLYQGSSLLKRRNIKKRYEVLKNFDNQIPGMILNIELAYGSNAAEQAFEIAWRIFRKYIEEWNKAEIERSVLFIGDEEIMSSTLSTTESRVQKGKS